MGKYKGKNSFCLNSIVLEIYRIHIVIIVFYGVTKRGTNDFQFKYDEYDDDALENVDK